MSIGLGIGEVLFQSVKRRRQLLASQWDRRFANRIARQFGGQLAHRHPALRERVEHQRHADEAVAHQPHARVDHAAASFAPQNCPVLEHQVDHVCFADRAAIQRHFESLGHVLRHPARGAIHHDRALLAAQNVIDAQSERVFLAEIVARFVDDRQPIGIGILAKADVGSGLAHQRQNRLQIVRRRLGHMLEQTIRLAADDFRFNSQRGKHPPSQDAARSMIRIEQHLELPRANPLDVDRLEQERQVILRRIGRLREFADPRCRLPVGRAAAILIDHRLARVGRNDSARLGEQLQTVVLRRVVARRNLDSARRLIVANERSGRGRCRDARIDHVAADRREPTNERRHEHRPCRAAIARDHDRPRRQAGGEGRGIADRDLGRQAFANDPAQAGNADDRFGWH